MTIRELLEVTHPKQKIRVLDWLKRNETSSDVPAHKLALREYLLDAEVTEITTTVNSYGEIVVIIFTDTCL